MEIEDSKGKSFGYMIGVAKKPTENIRQAIIGKRVGFSAKMPPVKPHRRSQEKALHDAKHSLNKHWTLHVNTIQHPLRRRDVRLLFLRDADCRYFRVSQLLFCECCMTATDVS